MRPRARATRSPFSPSPPAPPRPPVHLWPFRARFESVSAVSRPFRPFRGRFKPRFVVVWTPLRSHRFAGCFDRFAAVSNPASSPSRQRFAAVLTGSRPFGPRTDEISRFRPSRFHRFEPVSTVSSLFRARLDRFAADSSASAGRRWPRRPRSAPPSAPSRGWHRYYIYIHYVTYFGKLYA